MNLGFSVVLCGVFLAKPFEAFQIYWNVPTEYCKNVFNISFEYIGKDFGITQNKGDKFKGDEITILYNPGLFPEIKGYKYNPNSSAVPDTSNYTFINGGLPQDGNLTKHFEAFKKTVDESVPDKNMKGPIIIDMEHFGATWNQNFIDMEIYKILSRKSVRDRFPSLSNNMVEAEAKKEYEAGAQLFMDRTLQYAKTLRPNGKWGYYQYPQCFNPVGADFCSKGVQKESDMSVEMYRLSDALYPSLYLGGEGSVEDRAKQITGRVREAFRVMKVANKPCLAIPYTNYKTYSTTNEISDADLENLFAIPKKEGAHGVVIWGAWSGLNTKEKCQHIDQYFRNTLGPMAKKYID